MNEAIRILFEEKFGKNQVKLFNNRLDLANNLLKDKDSSYFLSGDEADIEIYNKHLNRLQSYISQIFSGAGTRKITGEFKTSLKKLIEKKLEGIDDLDVQSLYDKVIKSLEEINVKQPDDYFTSSSRNNLLDEFLFDFKAASYAVVFTSRPLELEAKPNETILKIRNAVVDGICNHFLEPSTIKQKYRYNFPNHHLGILFWRRMTYLIIKKLQEMDEGIEKISTFMENIYKTYPNFKEDFNSKLQSFNIELASPKDDKDSLRLFVYHFFSFMNQKACFQVFESKEPVFMIPHIIFNPNESNNIKGYVFLDEKNNSIELYKHGNRDLTVWKDKVWDAIKVNKNTREIPYIESIEDNVVFNFI